jgi:hypothetical protein
MYWVLFLLCSGFYKYTGVLSGDVMFVAGQQSTSLLNFLAHDISSLNSFSERNNH